MSRRASFVADGVVASAGRVSLAAVTNADAAPLAELRVEAMRESLERVGRFDPERARQRFLSTFLVEDTWHVERDGLRVGFVVVRRDSEGLLLDHLYVHPSHQGQGIGSAALGLAFDRADAESVPLRVGALRESASNRFYLRHGFMKVGESAFDNHYVRAPGGRLSVPRTTIGT